MPSWELFERQDQAYREQVLPSHVTIRVSVEQAATTGWARYVGTAGISIGMNTFGSSAPLKRTSKMFRFTPDRLLSVVKSGWPPVGIEDIHACHTGTHKRPTIKEGHDAHPREDQ